MTICYLVVIVWVFKKNCLKLFVVEFGIIVIDEGLKILIFGDILVVDIGSKYKELVVILENGV